MVKLCGTSAGTQTFKSVEKTDVILVIGANPTYAHPVFASRMKRRIKQGAKVIVIDPRVIDLVESPHVKAEHHLQLSGTNVAVITALAHVIVTEKLYNDEYVKERCEDQSFQTEKFVSLEENSLSYAKNHRCGSTITCCSDFTPRVLIQQFTMV